MDGFIRPAQRAVHDAYERTKGPVAYLDESYQAPADGSHQGSFYLFTAVLVAVKDMATLRSGLDEIADCDYWHTSEALKTDDGRALTRQMLDYLAEGIEPCVITHRVTVDADDSDAEEARKQCYQALTVALTTGRTGAWDPVDLLILEERNQRNFKNKDQANHKELVSTKLVPRQTRLLQTSPSCEHLLWLPDLAASAYRRTITHQDRSLFQIIKDQSHFVALT
ncbi:hypothetical protein ACRDU6_09385 [Mycolicibacterium sp. ELW1]|uniref:hypothetical protein n=1 Tax=Mycobacteriaceae TaxID=1762 RepID=UPI0011ECB91F|nr:hypothetical protein [Mycobacterium sp. ELW1]QEN12872.1 hypothetical protein D3H54_05925 [Mycobacterium sp. ELW1]